MPDSIVVILRPLSVRQLLMCLGHRHSVAVAAYPPGGCGVDTSLLFVDSSVMAGGRSVARRTVAGIAGIFGLQVVLLLRQTGTYWSQSSLLRAEETW